DVDPVELSDGSAERLLLTGETGSLRVGDLGGGIGDERGDRPGIAGGRIERQGRGAGRALPSGCEALRQAAARTRARGRAPEGGGSGRCGAFGLRNRRGGCRSGLGRRRCERTLECAEDELVDLAAVAEAAFGVSRGGVDIDPAWVEG